MTSIKPLYSGADKVKLNSLIEHEDCTIQPVYGCSMLYGVNKITSLIEYLRSVT